MWYLRCLEFQDWLKELNVLFEKRYLKRDMIHLYKVFNNDDTIIQESEFFETEVKNKMIGHKLKKKVFQARYTQIFYILPQKTVISGNLKYFRIVIK